LYLRSLGSTTPRVIPGSEGATFPFWSPDSRQLAFFADGKLKKLDLNGGAPMTIASAPEARGGTWGRDGTILFAGDTQAAISSVSAGGVLGGPATTVDPSRGGETTHRYPWFLPDGRHFLYVRASHAGSPGRGQLDLDRRHQVEGDLRADAVRQTRPTRAVICSGCARAS
jgi:hypothetical protein